MNKDSILVINRWNDQMISYEDYINHHQYKVFYLTNEEGRKGIKSSLTENIYVTSYLDNIFFDKNVDTFLSKARPNKIIAFSEVDQELAALLRTKLSIPGTNLGEIKKFRNKIEMKDAAEKAKIKVPFFSSLCDIKKMSHLLNNIGYPLILKPINGVSSEGVIKISSQNELNNLLNTIDPTRYECEQFIDGKIYHADGLVYNNNLIVFKVSEYINTCFEYTQGKPLGSVIINEPLFESRTKLFTQEVIRALSLANGAFHLEFIVDKHNQIYFLEIGARVGGAQVPRLFKDIYGVNLFHEWVNIQVENKVSLSIKKASDQYVGGWLLFPEPKRVPCRVEYCRSLKNIIPLIFYEYIPRPGHIFNGGGEYRNVSGAYLYKGFSMEEIKNAINETIKQFCIKTTLI